MRGVFLSLCGLLILVSQPSAAQSPQAQSTWTPRVKVFKVSLQGGRQPVAGAEVVLEKWQVSPRDGKKLSEVQVVTTGKGGVATFRNVMTRAGITYVASTIADGLTFTTPDIEGFAPRQALELHLYETTQALDALEIDMKLLLEVREAAVVVQFEARLHNRSQKVIDLRDVEGLRVPLILPAIGDTAWTGYLPTEKAVSNIRLDSTPNRGRLSLSKGGIVYQGPIFPGEGHQRLRGSYAIPIISEQLDLAVVSDVPLIGVAIRAGWGRTISPRLLPTRPFDMRESNLGNTIVRNIKLRGPVNAGETLLFRFDRLPYALSAESNMAFYGGSFCFILFGLFVLIGRRRA